MKHILKLLIFSCIISLSMDKAYSQASNFGVNLAGLDFGQTTIGKNKNPIPILPGVQGQDYFVPTPAELDYYKGKGLMLIRLPFIWERIQPTLGGSLDPTYLSYMDGVVSAAASRGMSIMLDMHNYCRYYQSGDTITRVIGAASGPTLANFENVWTQLATHYANQSAVWGFDLMNEPHNLASISWATIAQAGITAVRTVDNTHVILVEGDNWSKGNTWTTYNNNLATLTDPNNNLVFEAHQYFDSNQSGGYSNTTLAGNGGNAQTGVTYITPFVDWLNSNKLKGIVGEYGVPNNNDLTNWNTMLTNFLTYIQQNCVGGTYWAGGPAWGNYITSIEPTISNGVTTDKPQMAILTQFTTLPSGCALSSSNVTISLTTPLKDTTIAYGNPVTILANATSTVDTITITQVDFYANDSLLGTSTTSPYSFTWNNPTPGTYNLTAKAITSSTQVVSSLGVNLYVAEVVYSATATPVIDGIADPMWGNYAASDLTKVTIGTVSSPSYLSANWKVTYDNTYLYVLVTVTDDILVNNPSQAVYNNDGIEIYVDLGDTKTLTYGANQFQYAFGWNNSTVYEDHHNATAGVIFAQTTQGAVAGCISNCPAKGYTMEVRIPWSTLGVTEPVQGAFEGFEVMVNDDDTGTRNSKIAWTATTDNAWQEPSLFGTIIMDTIPCIPPSPITITPSGSTTFCKGSSVILNATSNGAYAYQWYNNYIPINGATSSTITASVYGNYVIGITSNNCTAASVMPVYVDSTIASAGPNQFIATTSTTLAANKPFTNNVGTWTVSSGTGVFANASSYNTTVSGLSQGANVFTWTIASDSCGTGNNNVTVTVGTAPTPSVITGPVLVSGGQIGVVYSFTPSDPSDKIHWTLPTGATIASANADSSQITVNFGKNSGTVSVTETNLYASVTQTLSVTTPITIPVSGESNYSLYPNPYQTSSSVVVSSSVSGSVIITIIDMKGTVVASYTDNTNTEIKIGESLDSGIYLVRIQNGSELAILKLIKM